MRLECSFIYRLNFINHANIKRPLSTQGYFPNAGLSSLKANVSYETVKTGPVTFIRGSFQPCSVLR